MLSLPLRLVQKAFYPLLLLVCLLQSQPASAAEVSLTVSEAHTVFRRANEQYQQQNYPEARSLYSQIVQGGIRSPEVYYNLANTAARLGRTGEAVLYYERARELAPRDQDVIANLSRVAPAHNNPEHFVLALPFYWVLDSMSSHEWMRMFLIVFFVTGILGGLLLSRRLPPSLIIPGRIVLLGVALVTVAGGLFAGVAYYQSNALTYVIAMKQGTIIRSGPSNNYSQLISVPEGTKLRRMGFTDDPKWARVSFPNGQSGYTLAANLQSI